MTIRNDAHASPGWFLTRRKLVVSRLTTAASLAMPRTSSAHDATPVALFPRTVGNGMGETMIPTKPERSRPIGSGESGRIVRRDFPAHGDTPTRPNNDSSQTGPRCCGQRLHRSRLPPHTCRAHFSASLTCPRWLPGTTCRAPTSADCAITFHASITPKRKPHRRCAGAASRFTNRLYPS